MAKTAAPSLLIAAILDPHLDHHQTYGALRLKDGFGLNPLKLLLGYKDMLQAQGDDF
ncbi:hypothetical protein PEC18_34845 [Paucibacter sp. O1-1]|nr:hypothetical protein [Paucibacter sp. O1-1]MDA3830858.1 hypothetical protein [Paucibacter sp. O1-1]